MHSIQYSVCAVDAFKLSLSCWISETWPPLETRLKSAYYCTLWDSRSISHFVVAVVKCAIEQCACEWLGLGLSFFCLWGFKLYFWSQNTPYHTGLISPDSIQITNTMQGLKNWSWKQINVSFEAFLVGNQG